MKRNISRLAAMFLTAAMAVVPVSSMAELVEQSETALVLHSKEVEAGRFIENAGTVLGITQREDGTEALVEVGETKYRVNLPKGMLVIDQEKAALARIEDIVVESKISFYTTAKTPVGKSYPAFLTPEFIILNTGVKAHYVGTINEKFMSSNMDIQFNIGEGTAIIPQNGTKIALSKEQLINKHIVAIYSIATASIPTQTNPELIILLNDEMVHEEELTSAIKIPMFTNEHGFNMIGFSATALSKGYEVYWDAENQIATATKGEHTAVVSLKTGAVSVDGKEIKMAHQITTVEGRVFLEESAFELVLK